MLKIHVVRQGGHRYYVDDLVPGRAEGTLVAGEAPGRWSGTGASALGVTGTVEARAFGEVLEGRDPWSGTALRAMRADRSVAGYDLTFCAPKSVSLLHLLAPREMAGEVGVGHQAAVDEATGYLQRVAVGVRRTRGGHPSLLPSTGVVAGRFLHRTSRSLDPHLHTHLVVANVTLGVDGAWSAVDGRRIFAHARAVQAIYHAHLRLELSDRLGAAWEVPPSGLGDVIGVDPRMRRLYSQRSAAIDEYVVRRIGSAPGPTRRRGAFHATRPHKDRTPTVAQLRAEWKQRATDFGFDLGDLTRVVGLGREIESVSGIDEGRVRDQLNRLALGHRTLARRDLVAVIADASIAGTRAQVAESVAAHVIGASGSPLPVRDVECRGAEGAKEAGDRRHEPRWAATDVARAVASELVTLPESAVSQKWIVDVGGLTPGFECRAPGRISSRAHTVDGPGVPDDVQLGR